MIVTLERAKEHLRVTSDEEDALITLYIEAAGENIKDFLNRPVPEGSFSAQAAALLMIGDMYENREAQILADSVNENPAVLRFLHPLRDQLGV